MIVCDFCSKTNKGLREYEKRGGNDFCEYCVKDYDRCIGDLDKAHQESRHRITMEIMKTVVSDEERLKRGEIIK